MKTLTALEIRAAMEVSCESYPFNTICANCGEIWGAHLGKLCPAKTAAARASELMQSLVKYSKSGEIPERAKYFSARGTLFLAIIGDDRGMRIE